MCVSSEKIQELYWSEHWFCLNSFISYWSTHSIVTHTTITLRINNSHTATFSRSLRSVRVTPPYPSEAMQLQWGRWLQLFPHPWRHQHTYHLSSVCYKTLICNYQLHTFHKWKIRAQTIRTCALMQNRSTCASGAFCAELCIIFPIDKSTIVRWWWLISPRLLLAKTNSPANISGFDLSISTYLVLWSSKVSQFRYFYIFTLGWSLVFNFNIYIVWPS